MRRVIAAIGLAFATSALLYEPMHKPQVPELARYVSGASLFTAVLWLLSGDRPGVNFEHIALAWLFTGFGVALNRLRLALLGW